MHLGRICHHLAFRWVVVVTLLAVSHVMLRGQTTTATGHFEQQTVHDEQGDHAYTVFLPAGYRADRKYPVVLFLHGAGERGRDGHKQLTVGLAPYVKARAATFPFIAVFPQCEDLEGRLLTSWKADTSDGRRALKILDEVQSRFSTDPKRAVLVGWSMGAYGALSLGAAEPARWAAVVAISGGAEPDSLAPLKNTPVWIFHGAKDKIVPVAESRAAAEALKTAGGNVTYTEFPDAGHVPFEETFGNDSLVRWMLDPKTPAQLAAQPKRARPLVSPPPFVPAVEIPKAVGIRLGNDALQALSYAGTQLVPPNLLTGTLGDMYDSTSAAGRQFNVTFSGIRYNAQLERVVVKSVGDNRVNVQLGLRNAIMTIGGTSVIGARHSAQAGPINIGIGHNGPVWLSLDVAPSVANRKIRLQLLGASFQIPPNNFYVTQPAGVSVAGFGMTQERVVESLTSGLYGSRGRIENEVRGIAPRIVQQLEENINLAMDATPLLAGLWPLPVYEPQMKIWPEAIHADKDGLTLLTGLTAAQPDPFIPAKKVQMADPAGVSQETLGREKTLRLALSPQILSPLTNLLIDEHLGAINVLDIPEKSFARLADRTELVSILPDLSRYGDALQTRAVLRLEAPLETGANGENLEFHLPKLQIAIAIQTSPEQPDWKPCAEFDLELRQSVHPTLSKPTFARREVLLGWKPDARITGVGRFAEGYEPQNTTIETEKFVELCRDSWSKWTGEGSTSETSMPDISLGNVKLRMNELGWSAPVIQAEYKSAGIKITNLSEEPFTYEARGPYSPYGGPYTLKPGQSHEFDIPYPLTYRRQAKGISEVYTLLSGMHSEFRVPMSGGAPRLFQAKTP